MRLEAEKGDSLEAHYQVDLAYLGTSNKGLYLMQKGKEGTTLNLLSNLLCVCHDKQRDSIIDSILLLRFTPVLNKEIESTDCLTRKTTAKLTK